LKPSGSVDSSLSPAWLICPACLPEKGRFVLIKKGRNAHGAHFWHRYIRVNSKLICSDKEIKPTALNMETSMRTKEYESHVIYRFLMEDSGASLMEYALIVAIIAVIAALIFLALSAET
jgi:hypothetical protein